MDRNEKIKVVLITGLSGAGKTHAADWFEDQDYYCIDNLPPQLIGPFLQLIRGREDIRNAAFVVDSRSDEFFGSLGETITVLERDDTLDFRMLFMEAATDTLIRRFNESRRHHPLGPGPVTADVIERERELLKGLRDRANFVLDTTEMKLADFNQQMSDMFLGEDPRNTRFSVNLSSFGYKYGIQQEADLVIDMRFLPNPFYVASLKKLTGNNQKVRNYVMHHEVAERFAEQMEALIHQLVPYYIKEGKYHLNIAFGCTGGQHRSVVMANEMADRFRRDGYRVSVTHRDLHR